MFKIKNIFQKHHPKILHFLLKFLPKLFILHPADLILHQFHGLPSQILLLNLFFIIIIFLFVGGILILIFCQHIFNKYLLSRKLLHSPKILLLLLFSLILQKFDRKIHVQLFNAIHRPFRFFLSKPHCSQILYYPLDLYI